MPSPEMDILRRIDTTAIAREFRGPMEVIGEPLYDWQHLTERKVTRFYQYSMGGHAEGLDGTGQDLCGQFPGNQAYLVTGMAVLVIPPFRRWWYGALGHVELRINSRVMNRFPLGMIPLYRAGYSHSTRIETKGKTTVTRSVEVRDGALTIDPIIQILPTRAFEVTVSLKRVPHHSLDPVEPIRFPVTWVLTGYRLREAF